MRITLPRDLFYILYGSILYLVILHQQKHDKDNFLIYRSPLLSLVCGRPLANDQVLVPLAISQAVSLLLVLLESLSMIRVLPDGLPVRLETVLFMTPFLGIVTDTVGSAWQRHRRNGRR